MAGHIPWSTERLLVGQLAVCAGTTGPGSNHLVAGLYEASRDHAPVLALSGDMPRKLHGIDFIQTTEPDLLFRDVSLYTETVSSPAQAPTVIHQAIAAAYAGRGVAHLTLPHEFAELGWRHRHRHDAELGKPLLAFGIGQACIDRLVELVDDLDGCIPWRAQMDRAPDH